MFHSKESTQTLLAPLAACCQRSAAAHALIQLFQASGKKIRDKSSKCIMNYNFIYLSYICYIFVIYCYMNFIVDFVMDFVVLAHAYSTVHIPHIPRSSSLRLRIPAIASACKPKSPSLSSGSFIPHKQDIAGSTPAGAALGIAGVLASAQPIATACKMHQMY